MVKENLIPIQKPIEIAQEIENKELMTLRGKISDY